MLSFRYILILLILGFSKFSFASEKEDIIKRINQLNNIPAIQLEDSIKTIGNELYNIDQQSGRELILKMAEITKGKNKKAYLDCLTFYALFSPGREIELFDSAYYFAQKNRFDFFTLDYYQNKSFYYSEQGKLDSSMIYILMARDLAKNDNLEEYVTILHQIGDIYYSVSLFDHALKYYHLVDSLKGSPEVWEHWRKWVIHNNIGLIEFARGDYGKALSAFREYEQSRPSVPKNYNDSLARCYTLRKIGEILYEEGEYEEALKMMKFPFDMSLKYQFRDHLPLSLITLIQLSIKTGNKADVLKYNAILTDFFKDKETYLQEDIFLTMINAEVCDYLGDYALASDYYKEYIRLNDSLAIQEKTAAFIQLLTEKDYNQLESNLQQIKEEKKYLFIIIILLIISGYIIIKRSRKISKLYKMLHETNLTKDKLFSIISHDLKSPCNAMLGLNDVINVSLKEHNYKEAEEISQMLSQKSKELYSLITNLLDWSRSQQGSIKLMPENISINHILSKVVNIYEPQATLKNICVGYKQNEDFIINADEYSLITIFSNLLSNAIKFTPNNGAVTIKVIPATNKLNVTISDNGVGIPDEKLTHLFDKNNNVSTWGTNNEKGTGLGLLICKEFVDKNGGTIKVESRKGEGTTFTVGLNC